MEVSSDRAAAVPPRTDDRRTARHQRTRDDIVVAAWDLARRNGLAALSLRELGARVGMRAQSLYSYFASKNDIYDAMFREGAADFAAVIDANASAHADPRARVVAGARAFFAFSTADPVRFQLLFQRPLPDFRPSPASYAIAVRAFEAMAADLGAVGVRHAQSVDLWTAVLSGLAAQQLANDPGGRRWAVLVDRAVAMLLHETVDASPALGGDRDEPDEHLTATTMPENDR